MHRLTILITNLGDSAVTLPMAAVTIAILLIARRIPPALWWGGCIGASVAVITGLKLVLTATAPYHHALTGLASPSGHAGISTIVYGGFVLLIGPSLPPVWRVLARLGVVVLIAAIAVSRPVLHDHSIAETVVGFAVGLAALGVLRAGLARFPAGRMPVLALCAAALAVIGLMHGKRWQTEPVIRALAHLAWVHDLPPWHG